MKVQIRGDISGTRNGVVWPKRGSVVDLPDDEAENLIIAGLAVEVAPDPEPAPEPVKPEPVKQEPVKPAPKPVESAASAPKPGVTKAAFVGKPEASTGKAPEAPAAK